MKMIRILSVSAILLALAVVVKAETDQKVMSATVSATSTNTATVQMRGEVRTLFIVVPPLATCDVSIVSSDLGPIFAKTGITAGTNVYHPRVAAHTTAGAAYTYTTAGSLDTTTVSSAVTVPILSIGDWTATFTGKSTVTGAVKAIVNIVK